MTLAPAAIQVEQSSARVLFHPYETPTAFVLSLQLSILIYTESRSLSLLSVYNCSYKIFDYSLISASPKKEKKLFFESLQGKRMRT